MRAAITDFVSAAPRHINSTINKRESSETVDVLEELLAHSVRLRDLYKAVRCKAVHIPPRRLHQLFDCHYREQIQLVDTLIDRIRTLDGAAGVFAADLLRWSEFPQRTRDAASITQLLARVMDAHDSILSVALPNHSDVGRVESSWSRDFAVGMVVLTNNQQIQAVSAQLKAREASPRNHPSFDD
jgi:starvation-inducible DNA-binding protein